MRITGGQARGIPLVLPKGDAVRPATDAMRQAVFSSLAARVAGARFLDLFAGSGAYGLEALSRGAADGVFVEKNARTADFIRQNIAAVCKSQVAVPAGRPVTLALGAERGWSPAERTLLRESGFTFGHLGDRVLRTETACIAAVTLLRAKLGLI